MTAPAATPILYSKPGCYQCVATSRKLTELGVEHEYRDVTTNPEWHDEVVALGYAGLPVVAVGDIHWQGYQPDALAKLA